MEQSENQEYIQYTDQYLNNTDSPFCDDCNTVKDPDGECKCTEEQLNLFI